MDRRILAALPFLICFLARSAFGADYYVAPTGNDGNAGTSAATAWKTLQHAADVVGPGDVVHVLPGNHAGFNLFSSGTPSAPIVFTAADSAAGPNPAVVIDQNNAFTGKDRVNLEGASHVVIEGFTILGTGHPSTSRACIRTVGLPGAHARFVVLRRNRCDLGGRWGILTGFVDDVTIEDNETSRSAAEHGIYVSNSGDRPVIRRNHVWGNHSNGIHMNGDQSLGGDGVISDALVERNVIHGNGAGNPAFGPPGGSAINCDGVVDSVIRNNLLYDNHKSGISLYRIDGGAPSTGNLVVNNTVHNAADARWALNLQDGAQNNVVRNNVLFNDHPFRGAIDASGDSLPGLVSNHNVVKNTFSIGGTFVTLAEWQAQTGQDGASLVSTPAAAFAAAADYQAKPGSPLVDTGTAQDAPAEDLLGKPRPAGAGFDRGCYEFLSCVGSTQTLGGALPGTGGVAPQIVASGCPDQGDLLTLSLVPSIAGAPGLLVAGAPSAPLPAFQGFLFVTPQFVLPLAGGTTLAIPVPALPGLAGTQAAFQTLWWDAGAPAGVALSAALLLTIG